jgi:hypothetical protein
MRYVRLEKRTTKFVEGKKTAHSITYARSENTEFGPIRWQHVRDNAQRLKWDSYEVFTFRGDFWFWKGNAYSSFSEAYNYALENQRKTNGK